MPEIITEGRVVKNILSFGESEYLYTGTVCRPWYENSKDRVTHVQKTVETLSRVNEALDSGVCIGAASFFSIETGQDISVIDKLHKSGARWDDEDLWSAAKYGRIDIMNYMISKGFQFDEKVLHNAVRYNQVDVVKWLLDKNCPIDKTVIEWGYGPNIVPELKMRSMELAISQENLEILRMLVGSGCPFIDDTYRIACETKYPKIVQYLEDQGCDPDEFVYYNYIENKDFSSLEFIFKHGLMKSEWRMCVGLCDDWEMIYFLISHGIRPKNEDVDDAIEWGNLELAKFFTREFNVTPKSSVYLAIFTIDYGLVSVERYIEILDWLFYIMGVKIGFNSYREFLSHSHVTSSIGVLSDTIFDWFKERLS